MDTRYIHYREKPYHANYAEIVACGRRVNRLAVTRKVTDVTCPKCLLCACNHLQHEEGQG